MKMLFKSFDELPLSLNAEQVAQVLGISRAGAYNAQNCWIPNSPHRPPPTGAKRKAATVD